MWSVLCSKVPLTYDIHRQTTEALLRYNLYVDCMPCDGLQDINKDWLDRMLRVARSTGRLKQPGMDAFSSSLSKEVRLEFTRTMGRILFDKTVTSQPGAFPFVTLPDPPQEEVRETGENSLKNGGQGMIKSPLQKKHFFFDDAGFF